MTTFVLVIGAALFVAALALTAFLVLEIHFMRLEERVLEGFDRATRKFMAQQEFLSIDDRARFFGQLDSFRAGRS